MTSDGPLPDQVVELAGSDHIAEFWRNELDGRTFRVQGREGTRYIKWQPYAGLEPQRRADVDLAAEADKLRWAGLYVPVPRVLDGGTAGDCGWLITEGIDAVSAVDARWRTCPEVAVIAIAKGLRRLHDALPVEECPYRGSWVDADASRLPEPEHLVVCHGDACVPNTLLSQDGEFVAHVDLSRLGVADRWADLAIATYSIGWDFNFGQNYDELFFDTYGVHPDFERIRIYRELWDAP